MRELATLKTSRLQLRPIFVDDAEDILGIFGSDAVTRHYDLETFTKLQDAQDWIELMQNRVTEGSGIRWGISKAGSRRLVGTCGFTWKPHNYSAMLGYDIGYEHWGAGIATEAVAAIVDAALHGTAPFPVNRIEAVTYPNNLSSIAVLKKVGFEQEGLLRQWGYWKQSFHDVLCFSLLKAR